VIDAHRTALLVRARWPRWVPDVLAAALAGGVLVVVSAHIRTVPSRPLDALGYALLVAAGVSMGLCRRWPKVAVGVVTVVLGVFVVRPYPDGPVWVTGWIALAALSWRTNRRVAFTGAAVMLVVLSVTAAVAGRNGLLLPLIFTGWIAATVFGTDALRSRRSYLAGLRERALSLERTREEEARRRVAEERLRIARDLHDSVAHAMATINVQAGAARHVLAKRPEAAGEALAVIQRASGDVLDELAAMLTVLRDDAQRADRAPVPGAVDIARLARATTASGLAVALSVEGPVNAGIVTARYVPAPTTGRPPDGEPGHHDYFTARRDRGRRAQQGLRPPAGGRQRVLHRSPGLGYRLPRAERGGKVHHAADPGRTCPPERRARLRARRPVRRAAQPGPAGRRPA
jgi:signal transduction histidine kinase